jgi:predicted nucleic acid-binding protein
MADKTYCLASDVLIWHFRNSNRREAISAYLAQIAGRGSFVCSALTVAEVEQGMRPHEESRTRGFLRALACYPVDRTTAERAGEIVRALRSRGETLGLADALIAATCLVNGFVLVTLNVKDLGKVAGLQIQAVP